jgi:membrane-bound lytic murein transglycosylase D
MEKRVSMKKTPFGMTLWRDVRLPRACRPRPLLLGLVLTSLLGACSTLPENTPQPVTVTPSIAAVPLSPPPANVPPPVTVPELQPTDPLRPGVDVQAEADTRADLWSRVRRGFAMPDLDNELVRGREQWYATRPDYVDRMTLRGSRYLFHIVEEVERRNMPTELALLPFIESAFNPEALSTAKASGMWQFMPATGKDYDLKQNIFRDDRRDVLASTRAALDYLQRLYGMFGDWHLALAAYNWGEGSVQRAINRNRNAGLPTDYSSLRMPNETQYYVPKFQAVKNIIKDPQAFDLRLPELQNHPYFLSVPISRDMDLEVAARLAQMPLDEFKALNPQMNKPVILAAVTPQILLPYDNANLFAHNAAKHRGATASWTAWVAPRNIRPADAARQWGISESSLREINRIPPHMLIKAGSTLVVPRHPHSPADVAEHIADNATIVLAPEPSAGRRMVLRTKPRETVAGIAQRYKVSAAQIAEWNNLDPHTTLKPGQALVVYVTRASSPRRVATPVASKARVAPTERRGATRTATRATPPKRQAAQRGSNSRLASTR